MLLTGAHVQCVALGLHVSAQNSLSSGRESPDLTVGLLLPKKIAGLVDRAAVVGDGQLRSCWWLEGVQLAPAHLWVGVFSEKI